MRVPVSTPGGHLEGERAAGAHPAVAGALVARVGDELAEALAGHARAGGHHLAEEAALHLLDLAATGAHVAGAGRGARLHAGAAAGGAGHRGVDGEVLLRTEHGVAEVDVEPHQGVLAAGGARARAAPGGAGLAAEEGVHDVAEREALAEAGGARAVGVGAVVVGLLLVRVGQHVVGLGELLELLLGLRARVDVGVVAPGGLAVGALDVLRGGVAGDPEVGVVVVHRWQVLYSREDPRDVGRDGAHGGHRRGVVHPGRADDAEAGDEVGAGAVAGGDHRGGLQPGVRVLVPDAHGDAAALLGDGAEQLEQHDVLLEGLEHRAQAHGEVGADPGEVGGAGEHDALLALLDEGVLERGADAAHEVAHGRVEPLGHGRELAGRLGEGAPGGGAVELGAQASTGCSRRRRRAGRRRPR